MMAKTTEKTFTPIDVANIVCDVAICMVNDDAWVPEKDKKFIFYLYKLGVLEAWEDAYGKIAKKYRPKDY